MTLSLPVLGVETRFVTISERARDIVLDAYGHWGALRAAPGLVRSSPGEVHILVRNGRRPWAGDTAFEYSVPHAGRMEVSGRHAHGYTSSADLRAIIEVDAALLDVPRTLVRDAIEPLVLFLLGAQDRVPVHAAAVTRGGVGVVLAGPSGVGKSTLVFAAARRGYSPLSDDPVYVQVDPTLRVWGRRGDVHLRSETRTHFPDLAGATITTFADGKKKIVLAHDAQRLHADRVGLCILSRNARRPGLERVSPEEARDALTARLDPGFDLFATELPDRILRLSERGAWRMELGDSPTEAAALLDEVVRSIDGDA